MADILQFNGITKGDTPAKYTLRQIAENATSDDDKFLMVKADEDGELRFYGNTSDTKVLCYFKCCMDSFIIDVLHGEE